MHREKLVRTLKKCKPDHPKLCIAFVWLILSTLATEGTFQYFQWMSETKI